MYYAFACTYCSRLFYTYSRDKYAASIILYNAVKQHLIAYNEDHKEYAMDDGEQYDSQEILQTMSETQSPPPGAYQVS